MQQVVVGLGSCGIAAGGKRIYERFAERIRQHENGTVLKQTGCVGMCYREVLVEVIDGAGRRTLYGEVSPERVDRIVDEHLQCGRIVEEWVVDERESLAKQRRIVLRNCGRMDPDSLDEYHARDGYRALEKVLTQMTPPQVIQVIADSGLRGRGGAGFPTGTKWRLARSAKDSVKYVVCNADEGDPGAFMDRSVLEGDPHSVLEGMAIAAYAIGAKSAYVYVRAEYPEAVRRLRHAIRQAKTFGLLGTNILGAGFEFHAVSYTHLTLPTKRIV